MTQNKNNNSTNSVIVIVGGGSAGHVLPALPVAQRLIDQQWQVHFVGTNSGMEERLLGDRAIQFHSIASGRLRRYFSWRNFSDVFRILLGIFQSINLLRKIKPNVIFSKGGFVSFPLVFAGWMLRIPIVAHESDLTPGLANRLVMPFVATLCTSFAETRFFAFKGKLVHTGSPVREELLAGDAQTGRRRLGIGEETPILLVTGGSLGAKKLNQIVIQALPELCTSYFVVHVCGPGKAQGIVRERYIELEYVDVGWGDILAAADIVISRAGANAIFELWALQKVALLVPLPLSVSRGDQMANAAYAAKNELSMVAQEQDLNAKELSRCVENLAAKAECYETCLSQFMGLNASALLLAEVERLAK
jgi:UDP-N-acetylglucosamine--N-acetylmuramyl-(pentapeptide) pyrophosphoryl-undecaprenol N-acetylglucosamine transferase